MGEEPMSDSPGNAGGGTPEQTLAALTRGFGDQIAEYRALLDLARREEAAVASGDIDALAELLPQKQAVVARITERDRQLAPVKERWEAVRTTFSDDQKKGLQDKADELTTLLRQLLEIEKKNEAALETQRDEINTQLRQLRAKKTAHNAYQQESAQSPRFFDKRK